MTQFLMINDSNKLILINKILFDLYMQQNFYFTYQRIKSNLLYDLNLTNLLSN